MENSRRSIAHSEDSISMYLSFDTDADDTLASKWQSVMASQTSQYLEMQQSMDVGQHLDETLGEKMIIEKKTVLKSLIQNESTREQSPLRPFDQSLLNKHNALCSTPTKNKTLTDGRQDLSVIDANNKENTQPDAENTTLSSTIDGTASTVKINTLNDISVQESNNKTNNIYPLSADVLLENITEVSNEEPSMTVTSPVAVVQDKKESEVVNMVNEVSELINKALKLTEVKMKPKEQQKQLPKLPTVALPRPRRSFLPTSSGQTFKQRMSIVVKTTLNSPARKLATSNPSARRSFLPTAKPSLIGGLGYRRSTLMRSTESSCSISAQTMQTSSAVKASAIKFEPKPVADVVKFKCQLCSASFRVKNHLDLHMRKHMDMKKPGVCKFCDKKFALERALHIHLMQNCDKIPPAEKRKLQYTELNHVKKAQLPKLVVSSPAVSGATLKPRESTVPVTAPESESLAATPRAVKMAPPSMSKVPKKVAHAGVYRTPTKTVPCHSCGQSFKSIIDYTTHCLTMHSKSQKQETANAPSAQD
ncbi:sal-like protein 1 [Drosophila innubila]|uniref:sal-like protein 1 n=1 Tax=Drosophila innubila TaxID=198719 RepID=UPI00148BF31B|nr:sal-like protein 1 [Drosophila innubila]